MRSLCVGLRFQRVKSMLLWGVGVSVAADCSSDGRNKKLRAHILNGNNKTEKED